MVELKDRYHIRSNRESGFGRYDVMLEPIHPEKDDAMIMEFKVFDPDEEKTLQDTVSAALRQIRDKRYAQELTERGFPGERIRSCGFAFEGENVRIGEAEKDAM